MQYLDMLTYYSLLVIVVEDWCKNAEWVGVDMRFDPVRDAPVELLQAGKILLLTC